MDIEYFRKKLEAEKISLESELASVGRINPNNPKDWEPIAAELNVNQAEVEERASEISNYEERSAIEYELERKYNNVRAALERMQNNNYGICKTCSGPIAPARLEANPEADTCTTHMG